MTFTDIIDKNNIKASGIQIEGVDVLYQLLNNRKIIAEKDWVAVLDYFSICNPLWCDKTERATSNELKTYYDKPDDFDDMIELDFNSFENPDNESKTFPASYDGFDEAHFVISSGRDSSHWMLLEYYNEDIDHIGFYPIAWMEKGELTLNQAKKLLFAAFNYAWIAYANKWPTTAFTEKQAMVKINEGTGVNLFFDEDWLSPIEWEEILKMTFEAHNQKLNNGDV